MTVHRQSRRRRVIVLKLVMSLALVAGLGLFVGLAMYGGGQIVAVLAAAGWGLVVVTVFHLFPLITETVGWWVLFDRSDRPALLRTLRARWIGESVDALLPAAHVGGDLVKAGLLIRAGVPGAATVASVIVDLTLTVLTQILFTIVGIILLAYILGDRQIGEAVLAGVVLTGVLISAFYRMQRRGLFGNFARWFTRLANGRNWINIIGKGDAVDGALDRIYGDRQRIIRSSLWLFLAWLAGAGEIWLALYYLGCRADLADCVLIESLIQATRSLAFVVPGALGVQEAGFILLGGIIGVPPAASFALALTRRVRELCIGVPGLMLWQLIETKRVWGEIRAYLQSPAGNGTGKPG